MNTIKLLELYRQKLQILNTENISETLTKGFFLFFFLKEAVFIVVLRTCKMRDFFFFLTAI